MVRLAKEIDETKGELYSVLEAKKSLINKEVYMLSSKLDKLIFEYSRKSFLITELDFNRK